MKAKPHIAVIGAGAFGGWTALHLLERGARVTLLDAWGPGNSRASSGGETRVMRGTYGPDQPYTEMAARALKLWTKYERRWKRQFLHRTGVLWMASGHDDAFERGSIETLRAAENQISGTLSRANEKALAADQFRRHRVGNLRTRMRISRRPRQLSGSRRSIRRSRRNIPATRSR